MNDDLKKKFQEYQEMNNIRLEEVAYTFSMEGINRDLKGFIQKKISFNVRAMEHISTVLSGLANGDKANVRNILKDQESPINQMIQHLLTETRVVNSFLNTTIFGLLKREVLLSESDISEALKEEEIEEEETNISSDTNNKAES